MLLGAKVYQPLNFFKEKLIVYSYPLDQSSETSDVATASSRHRVANENIIKNPAKVTEEGVSRNSEGIISSVTHLTNKDGSEAVDRNKPPVTPRPQLVSNDISDVDKCDLSSAKRKKSTGDELSNKKKCLGLSQFKFRRTRAIQVLCHRASPSVKARIVQRRSRLLGASCVDKAPDEENVQNKSLGKTSTDVVGKNLDTQLGEKSRDIPEENNMNALDDKSTGILKDRTRNLSGKNFTEVLGKKSTAASMKKSENRKSLNLGNVTLVQCASRNELVGAITSSKSGELEKSIDTLHSEESGEQDGCVTSHRKKINDKVEGFCGKAVHPSKKRGHDESDSVLSALPVSKKLCIKKSGEVELQSSGEFPRHHKRKVGQQCSSTTDKCSQVTGAEAIGNNSGFEVRGNSKDEVRGNSNGEVTGKDNSNSEILHFSDGDIRHCSSDDFTHSSIEIKDSQYKFAGSSIGKDGETDGTNDMKGTLCEEITRNENRINKNKSLRSSSESSSVSSVAFCNADPVLSNRTNQVNQQILDIDTDFRTIGPKRLPTQKSRRLATKKKHLEKHLEEMTRDSSPGIAGAGPAEKNKVDLSSTPSDRPSDSFRFDPQKENSDISRNSVCSTDSGGLGSGTKSQIAGMSTSVADFALEKDVRLSSTVENQSVAKGDDGRLSSGSNTPALCDAPVSNLSDLSTSVTDSIGTANSQSCFANSAAMVMNTGLSGCDLVTTKTPSHADVIVIDSDNEDDVEGEIKAVR